MAYHNPDNRKCLVLPSGKYNQKLLKCKFFRFTFQYGNNSEGRKSEVSLGLHFSMVTIQRQERVKLRTGRIGRYIGIGRPAAVPLEQSRIFQT